MARSRDDTDDGPAPACPVRPRTRGDDAHIHAQLIAEISGGDRDAFTELYRMTSHRVYGLALRILGNRATAEEIAQEVYLQVWSLAARYDPGLASPIGWLMMLTHRRAVDRVRREHATETRDIAYGRRTMERGHDVVAETVDLRADRRAVLGCLDTLTQRQRDTIVLAYYGGLTYSDVADRLEVPVGTVKSRIRDGLERLRTCLTGSDQR
ncbi:sigma-70 family RNA polymerase sigma factor [Nocardia yunnanensis]|uniref:Sigma-70 family RNA polymerase sigma factor n=1 Tax=Nocardia yunnanensis TaxID=2382165 RepID=A0A386ZP65_9NOCA|nr:sigma-70 family RNA polymerase sigma factor [Nocardia yunnanensis]